MKVSFTDNVAIQKSDLKYFSDLGLEVDFYENLPDDQEELIKRIGNAEIAVFDLISKIDSQVINAVPNLKLLITGSTGFSNVDIRAAADKISLSVIVQIFLAAQLPNMFSVR
jgi:phosphoglycerate dehydrogenase-like enzyme